MRIHAILEFRKLRASFASFANKFVYRGIAAGLVPPVSLRRSRDRAPSVPRSESPRLRSSFSHSAVDGLESGGVQHSHRGTPRRRKSGWWCRGKRGRKAEVTRNGVENVKICAQVREPEIERERESGRQSPPAGRRDKRSHHFALQPPCSPQPSHRSPFTYPAVFFSCPRQRRSFLGAQPRMLQNGRRSGRRVENFASFV